MDLTTAVVAFLQQCRQRRRAGATIDQYAYQLQRLWLPWRAQQGLPADVARLTLAECQTYLDYLAHTHINRRTGQVGLSAETLYSAWRTLRVFWHYALSQGWLAPQDATFGETVVLPQPRATPAPPAPPPAWAALLAACAQLADPEERARNRVVLRLLEAGLRPGQVAALQDATVDLRERRGQITRPNGRPLIVTWGADAAIALRAYRRVRSGPPDGALVRSIYSSGAGQPLTIGTVRRIVHRMAQLAGLLPTDLP